MKKLLVILVGLMVFLCTSPVFAGYMGIDIPYAQNGGDWWSGLALSNTGPKEFSVRIFTAHSGSKKLAGSVTLPPYSQDVRLLPEFFTEQPYPTENDGRVGLYMEASGIDLSVLKQHFKVTLFVGHSESFSFQSYGEHDTSIFGEYKK